MIKTQIVSGPRNKFRVASKTRKPVSIKEFGLTRTHQSFTEECDINQIVRRANATGRLPDLIKENPQFADFSSPLDYQSSLNLILHANEQFAALPSSTRSRFQNDPEIFLSFATDPANLQEMVNLGLAIKRETQNTNNSESQSPTIPQKTHPSSEAKK